MAEDKQYIAKITLAGALGQRPAPEVEHERQVAIYDLTELNSFKPLRLVNSAQESGPYHLELSVIENRLQFHIKSLEQEDLGLVILSLTPFKRAIRDYRQICLSYYDAIRTAQPSRIEAIDMARRGIHDQAAELIITRLEGKIELDLMTARRFFTLLSTLFMKSDNDMRGIGGGA